jgi:hypothetical protein
LNFICNPRSAGLAEWRINEIFHQVLDVEIVNLMDEAAAFQMRPVHAEHAGDAGL